jgi:hypothetical protein
MTAPTRALVAAEQLPGPGDSHNSYACRLLARTKAATIVKRDAAARGLFYLKVIALGVGHRLLLVN